jgi:hypothetical protein
MPFTLLHVADLRLDTSFSRYNLPPETGNTCRRALRDACSHLIDIALKEKVDAITIAGNLFAAETIHPDTLQFLHQQLQRLESVPVYITPGKTDRLSRNSPYRLWRWPKNVRIFGDQNPSPVPLADGVTLWGAAHTGQEEPTLLPKGFHVEGEGVHLLLAYVPSKRNSKREAEPLLPIDLEDLQAAGFRCGLFGGSPDLLLVPESQPWIAFPGSPEFTGFDCQGCGGAILLRVDPPDVEVQAIPTRRLRFASAQIDVSDASSLEDVRTRMQEAITPGSGVIAQFRLTGRPNPAVFTGLPSLAESMASNYMYLDLRLEGRPGFDLEEISAQQNVRGSFVRRLLDQRSSAGRAQRRVIEEAIDAGLLAFENLEIPCP